MRTAITILATVVAVVVTASALGLGSPASGPDLPTVVSISVQQDGITSVKQIYRQWSDGRLDLVHYAGAGTCNPSTLLCVIQLLPGTTTFADVDRDGVVGITDFLAVIAAWDG